MSTDGIKITCDGDDCGKAISDSQGLVVVDYRELAIPERPEGVKAADWNPGRTPGTTVTLHFHEDCFDRSKALQQKRIEAASG